jgi:predicted O-methyltransferase YrrM
VQQLTTRGWRKIKSVLYPLPSRARNDYATHVPVLIGLAGMRRVERVLELGCGNYSTKTFLNRSAFPHLKELRSLENDPLWARTMRMSVAADPRCSIVFTNGAVAETISSLDLDYFDLVFVDDSTTSEQRTATIEALSALRPQKCVVVIHDYEVPDYQRAAAGFSHKFVFDAYNPATGVVSNSKHETQTDLRQLNHRLKANRHVLEPDDVAGWLRVLS